MTNAEVERVATEFLMELEKANGREPRDVRFAGQPYDVDSPPRKIEIKAFGASARGVPVPLEERQIEAAREDPDNFYLYVVDNVARADLGEMAVRILQGEALSNLIDAARPQTTFWTTYRTAQYDAAERFAASAR